MHDCSAAAKEDTYQGEERKNKSSDTQPIQLVQNEPEASKASRKDETRSRDKKSCSDISSYQEVKWGQTRIRKI